MRPLLPQNPAEVARLDQRHAEIAAWVDTLTRTPAGETAAERWLRLIEPTLNLAEDLARRDHAPFESMLAAIAAEALRRLAEGLGHSRTEYGVRWPGPWPESAGFMSPESAQRYATDPTVQEHGTVIERTIWTGPWRPVSTEPAEAAETDTPRPDPADVDDRCGRLWSDHGPGCPEPLTQAPWEVRRQATGGGPCPGCGRPYFTHVCLGCSPDHQTPGPGCGNCRHTGMDQTPCQPKETNNA